MDGEEVPETKVEELVDAIADAIQGVTGVPVSVEGSSEEELPMEEPEGEGTLVAEAYDGASPSGVSVSAMNLLRMGHLLQYESLTEKGIKVIAAQAAAIRRHPTGFTYLLTALNYAQAPSEAPPRCTAGGSCGLE